ncbi:MAG: antibiotic biosynthesis monooxygenase [Bacteroidetes bacterium]|nr:antibiotic biosynthesis monooxygenase [Bacteroidota bacterium]
MNILLNPAARLTKYHIKPQYSTQFRSAISAYIFKSLKAEGNVMAEAYFEREDSSTLWIIERWTSRDHLSNNEKSSEAKAIAVLSKTALTTPPETIFIEDLEPLPNEAYRKAPAQQDHPLTVMLFVDAQEGTEDKFKTIYHTAMPKFRGEPGVVTYQLSQIQGQKTKFVTYEKFRDNEAFQFHLKFPPIDPVIQYLRTSIKEPPFEKGIHNLIEFAPLYRK